jgi:hypothetical protein
MSVTGARNLEIVGHFTFNERVKSAVPIQFLSLVLMLLISYSLIVEIHMGTASALESGFDALYSIILVLRLQITPTHSGPLLSTVLALYKDISGILN